MTAVPNIELVDHERYPSSFSEIKGLPFKVSICMHATDISTEDYMRRMDAAERIVRTWNAHGDLVKALRGLLDCAGEDLSNASDEVLLRGVGDGPDDLTKEQAQAFLNARAAIAKATGEQP